MAESINLNGPYDTQIPGYDDDADIKKALRLFLYGSNTLPANMSQVQSESIAGYLKALQADIDAVDAKGIGSVITDELPTSVPNGYIWVDSTTSAESYAVPTWKKISSGSLSGENFTASPLAGEKVIVVLKDWSHNNSGDIDFSLTFNDDEGPNYINTGGLIASSHLSSPVFPNTGTFDMTVTVDLANTASALKPVSTIASVSAGSYFGYYKNTNDITSLKIALPSGTSFDAGSYEVWSYE